MRSVAQVLHLLCSFHSFTHSLIYPLIHSFIQAIIIAPLQVHYYSRDAPDTTRILYRSFTPSERFAQDPHVAARGRFEPANLRAKGDESTNEPPRRTTFRS